MVVFYIDQHTGSNRPRPAISPTVPWTLICAQPQCNYPAAENFGREAAKQAVRATSWSAPLGIFEEWVASRSLLDLVVYGGGSIQDGSAGAATVSS